MAIVKSIKDPPKTNHAVNRAIRYVTNEDKSENIFTWNCNGDTATLTNDFQNVRKIFAKDNGILAHHYVQSFSPEDKISLENAHEIGKQLIERLEAADKFQIVFATHKDKDHIHNHFIINSVSFLDGVKWRGNLDTLKKMREVSDKLCEENNLSIISKNENKGVDMASYKLGQRNESWKFELVRLLDEALEKFKYSKKKADFIDFLNKKDFKVKWKNKNITFTKNGEEKGIRADTLAKTFGAKYSKANIEKMLGVYDEKYDEKILANYYGKIDSEETMKKQKMPEEKRWTFDILNQVDEIRGEDFLGPKIGEERLRNLKRNKEIKAEAERQGQKPCYKIVTKEQLEKLKKADVEFAFFERGDDKFNIIFLMPQREKIENVIFQKQKNKNQTL